MSGMTQPDGIQVFWHDDVLAHDTGLGVWEGEPTDLLDTLEPHPENALRIRNMRSILERGPLAKRVTWREGRAADVDELQRVHTAEHIARVQAWTLEAPFRLEDGSTVVSPDTWRSSVAAAGTALAAVDSVLDGDTLRALALVRPPGHHAGPDFAGGYCFFNNVALMAQRARDKGAEKVAIVDWDVHHGNGTQAVFYDRADVLTISLHTRAGVWGPLHWESGAPSEVGRGEGQGFNVNIELPVGSGDQTYAAAMSEIVQPILEQFRPDVIIGAIGQDNAAFDGNGRANVGMDGFRQLGSALATSADALCDGRLALTQEGGYGITYAAFCLHATLEGVLGTGALLEDPLAYVHDDYRRAREAIDDVSSALSRHWSLPLYRRH